MIITVGMWYEHAGIMKLELLMRVLHSDPEAQRERGKFLDTHKANTDIQQKYCPPWSGGLCPRDSEISECKEEYLMIISTNAEEAVDQIQYILRIKILENARLEGIY